MVKKKKSATVEYALLSIPLNRYRATVDATINHDARDKRHHHADPKIYSFGSSLELEGVCDYPGERSGDKYIFSVHGWETEEGQFEARLSNRRVVDEDGTWKYRKVRGVEIPVFDVPEGLGLIERVHGEGAVVRLQLGVAPGGLGHAGHALQLTQIRQYLPSRLLGLPHASTSLY